MSRLVFSIHLIHGVPFARAPPLTSIVTYFLHPSAQCVNTSDNLIWKYIPALYVNQIFMQRKLVIDNDTKEFVAVNSFSQESVVSAGKIMLYCYSNEILWPT